LLPSLCIRGIVESMNFKGSLTTLILQNLKRGPNHGYRIAQEIKEKSKGVLDYKEGTLYPALHGLENKGLLESYTKEENGRTRCYYRLTEKGRKSLVKQREEWTRFSGAISMVLQET
jgi:PadR family transcriptional regulator, regulatory protein PadR